VHKTTILEGTSIMVAHKFVLITGCSSGIGLCAAQTLHQRGYQVFATVRKPEDKIRLEQQGLKCLLLDLRDPHSIQTTVTNLLTQTNGRIDALINNAGLGLIGAAEDLSRDSLREQFETNVFGPQELTNQIIPAMRRQGSGRIINVSSMLGLVTKKYCGAYCASKYALEALTDAMRLELQGSGIFVSLVEPGPITSEFRASAKRTHKQQIPIEQSIHRAVYTDLLAQQEKTKQASRFTLPPDAVVKRFIHALESPNPKIRYYVTVPAYLAMLAKRLLPSRWVDAIMVKQ
jgi:short-subunit dehydrogenase